MGSDFFKSSLPNLACMHCQGVIMRNVVG